MAGITPIALAQAETLVPDGFDIQTAGVTASFVVRLADCDGIAIDGKHAKPGTVVQVGVTIVPPDGNSANLNNYTGWYYTDHKALAKELKKAGMNAQYVKHLVFDYDQNAAGTGGTLHVDVPGDPSFQLDGEVGEPTGPPAVSRRLVAGRRPWRGRAGHHLQAIVFGTAPVCPSTTGAGSEIADLIGGPSATFHRVPRQFSRSRRS